MTSDNKGDPNVWSNSRAKRMTNKQGNSERLNYGPHLCYFLSCSHNLTYPSEFISKFDSKFTKMKISGKTPPLSLGAPNI